MGRGSSSFGGGSSRGSSSFGGGSSRGFSSSRSHGRRHSHTTVFVGGHSYHSSSSGSPWVGVCVGALFAFFGLMIVLFGFGTLFNYFKYDKVSATCVSNEYSKGYYYTHYDYTVDGQFYDNVRSNQGWQFEEVIGKTVTIYYLKSDPNEISEENPVDLTAGFIMIGFGLVFGGMGAIPMVLSIKEIKASKGTSSVGNVGSQPSVADEPSKRCPYCGAKYNKNSDTCPKCGASRVD